MDCEKIHIAPPIKPSCFVLQCVVLVAFLLASALCAPDNAGTEFIIGYMENIAASFDVELLVTTTKTTTVNVQISAPRYSSAGISESFTVTAGVVKELSFSPLIRMSGTNMDSKGILISADDEVVIYGVNKETYSCDAFLGLPTDVLGKEYLAITYYPPSRQCEILIAAVNDSTSVTVTLGSAIGNSDYVYYDSVYYYSGDSFSLSMDRYDTFQFYSTGDLSGTMIVADKNIAVFSGNKKTTIGSGETSDHLVEQLTRIDSWGKNFITVPIPLRTVGDYFRFIPSENSTTVTITGGYTETFTITNAGDMVEKEIPSTAYCKITSDKPILLVQFCLSQQKRGEKSDPMMMIIPPIEQFAADYTFATPKYSQGSYNNYFMFVVKESQKDGLRLDGDVFPSTTYNSISGTEYVAGYVTVSHGSHTVRHTSTISMFGGYLYGQAKYETYGFTTGMRMAPINTVCVNSTSVVGDGLDNDCDGLIDEELCTSANGGADNDGDGLVDEDCAKPAPVDGGVTDWTSWDTCTVTCGGGIQGRNRSCTQPAPAHGGASCNGPDSETQDCNTAVCIIDGAWGAWGAWGSYCVCTVTCGGGSQSRTRSCDSPLPANGGLQCSGDSSEFQSCNSAVCPSPSPGTYVQICPSGWFSCENPCPGGASSSRSCSGAAEAISRVSVVLMLVCLFVAGRIAI
ncbi:IgGFc-binding protein-like [Mizuhopecten yessoensis]|uniref:IgGFc-binding protein-like n=1 Tax=Mizuhopecten yessoensis TaxID=6573 RepID=UPI000B4595DF|nr:IgGFc-binding protein-like [Mizuhopecten yessoensis]